jgi:DNA-binding transcriptional LysR family regulator
MPVMFDWDLIRYFLAVARSGSTLTAATSLKQSQPTVARRIAALEEAVGRPLFDRRKSGYSLTAEGRALLSEAEQTEAAALRFFSRAGAGTRRISGTIRLTTFDMFANMTMGPALQRFSRLHPDVRVEVLVTDQVLDLESGEADIAIRSGERPSAGPFVSCKIGETDWTPYCSRSYAEANGHPTSIEAIDGHVLIGGDGNLAKLPAMKWLIENAPASPVRYRANAVQSLAASVKAGLGISVLPCAFFKRDEDLLACIDPPPRELRTSAWLITHERIKDEPHVRAMMNFLPNFLSAGKQR